jgi:hypothetical protein
VACTRLADDTPVAVIGDGESLRVCGFRGAPVAVDFDVYALACLRLGDGTSLAIVGNDRLRDEETARRYGPVQAWDLATGRRFGHPGMRRCAVVPRMRTRLPVWWMGV